MQFTSTVLFLAALAGYASAAPVAEAVAVAEPEPETANNGGLCTAEKRLAAAKQIIVAYAQPDPVSTYEVFEQIPFGVQDLDGPCTTVIYPNGGSGITVGVTGQGVVNFGVLTRQVFSKVTADKYGDFAANNTAVIFAEITLGVASLVPIPITFQGDVYLDFNDDCRMTAVRAIARIPTNILGQEGDFYKLLPIPELPTII